LCFGFRQSDFFRISTIGSRISTFVALALLLCLAACSSVSQNTMRDFKSYTLDYATPVDAALQTKLESIDARLRERFGMSPEQTSVGVLDLNTLRLAMVRPDRIDYAASVPKICILLYSAGLFSIAPASSDQPRCPDAA
jgi:hypothetical protein